MSGKYVLNKINDFAGNGAKEIAEFYSDKVGGPGLKFGKSVVNKGKKVVKQIKCKMSNLLGGSCDKSGGTPSKCGDGTEYVIKNPDEECLQVSPDCYSSDSEGKVYFSKTDCKPVWNTCTHFSSSYSEQMKSYWWYTDKRRLCNEYMHNRYFADIADPDDNPSCLRLNSNKEVVFGKQSQSNTRWAISKTDTERFKIVSADVEGPYGDVCLRSDEMGERVYQTRRRYANKVDLRGYDDGRRRRRCDKDGAKKFRIYQKLEPGNGDNYEKENGDTQFKNGCN